MQGPGWRVHPCLVRLPPPPPELSPPVNGGERHLSSSLPASPSAQAPGKSRLQKAFTQKSVLGVFLASIRNPEKPFSPDWRAEWSMFISDKIAVVFGNRSAPVDAVSALHWSAVWRALGGLLTFDLCLLDQCSRGQTVEVGVSQLKTWEQSTDASSFQRRGPAGGLREPQHRSSLVVVWVEGLGLISLGWFWCLFVRLTSCLRCSGAIPV